MRYRKGYVYEPDSNEVKEIIELYKELGSYRKVASKLHKGKSVVKRVLELNGFDLSPRKKGNCSFDNCENVHFAKGYCVNHYNRYLKTGSASPHVSKGYTIDKDGFMVCYKGNKKWFQHREIMEDHLGRTLTENEQVIHKNRNRQDNRIENLELKFKSNKHKLKMEVINKYKEGIDAPKIANIFSVSSTTIYNWLKEENVERRKLIKKPKVSNKKIRGICSRDDCNEPHTAKGFCAKHYSNFIRRGTSDYHIPLPREHKDITLSVREWTYLNWRPKIFKRDKYTCQKCGDNKGGNLNAHHIKPLSKIIDKEKRKWKSDLSTIEDRTTFYNYLISHKEITSIRNGITLCESCHTDEHRRK
jgi:transposase/5-methylcytosine-specific restriction endonuclease McrA